MKISSRISAFLTYLLPILGWLFVFLFRRQDRLAVFHTRQSIALVGFLVVVPAVWAVVAWVVAWIPILGPMTAAALFALVVAAGLFALAAWIAGMVYALQGNLKPLPLVGRWAP